MRERKRGEGVSVSAVESLVRRAARRAHDPGARANFRDGSPRQPM